jgi:hypothetical protein
MPSAELVELRKLWDAAPHSGMTDLLYSPRGDWLCSFREGNEHISQGGQLRILASPDGGNWTTAAVLSSPGGDLRDPHLSIAPDGRLALNAVEALPRRQGEHPSDPPPKHHQSLLWFSDEGRDWGERQEIGEPNFWLWRISWHRSVAYSVGYLAGPLEEVRLYRGEDSQTFQPMIDPLYTEGQPNEATLLFLENDDALCLLRREGEPSTALLGEARPPYTAWTWRDLEERIGGPQLIALPDGRFIIGCRLYEDGQPHTFLSLLDREQGALERLLKLPSGGDNSYPGMVWRDGLLWISYYSSHEGKASIYLAQVHL